MVTVSAPELIQSAAALAPDRFGPDGARALSEAYDEYLLSRRRPLAPFALWVDGRDYRSFYDALTDAKTEGRSAELRLGGPVAGGPGWEFLVPFRRLVLAEGGTAELLPGDGGPARRAIARFLLRDRYALGSAGSSPATVPRAPASLDGFGTFAEEIAACRSAPMVPFAAALLLYLPAERLRYELDLVRNYVLADPRAGRLAPARRVARTARFSWTLDRQIGRGRLSPLAARALELLAETHGLTAVELAAILGAARELVEAALRSVVDRGFASFDRRTARYHAQLEAFLPQTARSKAATPTADPALRTSVQELIAAAEAKATCPLCGSPLGGSSTKLLCDDCSKAVGL